MRVLAIISCVQFLWLYVFASEDKESMTQVVDSLQERMWELQSKNDQLERDTRRQQEEILEFQSQIRVLHDQLKRTEKERDHNKAMNEMWELVMQNEMALLSERTERIAVLEGEIAHLVNTFHIDQERNLLIAQQRENLNALQREISECISLSRSLQSTDLESQGMVESQGVFESLLEMMSDVTFEGDQWEQNRFVPFQRIMQFIKDSTESGQCSVKDLCGKNKEFVCNEHGQLTMINMGMLKMTGNFDLSKIPQTLETLLLNQNQLDSIGDFKSLMGSSLQRLCIHRNPNLNPDLSVFQDQEAPLPLRELSLSQRHILPNLGEEPDVWISWSQETKKQKISHWVRTSSLDQLLLVNNRCKQTNWKTMKFFKDGRIECR